jgi:hypothetical protein
MLPRTGLWQENAEGDDAPWRRKYLGVHILQIDFGVIGAEHN